MVGGALDVRGMKTTLLGGGCDYFDSMVYTVFNVTLWNQIYALMSLVPGV